MKVLSFPARLVAACVFAVSCLAAPVSAASDYLLEIEGIDSERPEKGIEIQAFSHDVKSPRDAASGLATGKRQHQPSFSDISVSKVCDKATPKLFLACCQGTHFPSATITCRKTSSTGQGSVPYMVVRMQDVMVSSYQASGATGDEGATNSFSLSFQKIEITFIAADGSVSKASWDLATNKGA